MDDFLEVAIDDSGRIVNYPIQDGTHVGYQRSVEQCIVY